MAPSIHQEHEDFTPSVHEYEDDDYDLDLSTGGFDIDQKDIIAPLHESTPPRRISFNPLATVYDILTLDDYTNEEFEASFFDEDEMEKMKETVRNEALLLDLGLQGPGINVRGLESRTKEGVLAKRQIRRNAYEAVFFEIDGQAETNVLSDTLIAGAYSFYSEPSARAAQAIAKEDELQAMAIYCAKKSKSMNLEHHFRKTRKNCCHQQHIVAASSA